MAKKRHSAEQILRKLREAEVELAKGARIKDVCRKLASSPCLLRLLLPARPRRRARTALMHSLAQAEVQ